MKIKLISENRVKVLVESDDIRRYKVPYEKLSSNDNDSMEFIYRLLFQITEETGVSFLESDLNIEVCPACGGNYFLMIVKEKAGSDGIRLQKENDETGETYILEFSPLPEIVGIRNRLQDHGTLFPMKDVLYSYNNKYYLSLDFSPEQTASQDFGILKQQLKEYGNFCKKPFETEGILQERGRIVSRSVF